MLAMTMDALRQVDPELTAFPLDPISLTIGVAVGVVLTIAAILIGRTLSRLVR